MLPSRLLLWWVKVDQFWEWCEVTRSGVYTGFGVRWKVNKGGKPPTASRPERWLNVGFFDLRLPLVEGLYHSRITEVYVFVLRPSDKDHARNQIPIFRLGHYRDYALFALSRLGSSNFHDSHH